MKTAFLFRLSTLAWEGSLYPALNRLESKGLVQANSVEEMHGRRGARRRFYRLKSKGKRALNQGREEWATLQND